MATAPQSTSGDDAGQAADMARTATERESDSFLDRETAGQVLDENDSGQQMADQMDDSLRADQQAPVGRAAASDQNVPDQLSHPREVNFTLPETQHQGRTLTADGDDE